MEYKKFENAVVDAIENKIGEEYRVEVHQVSKNNGVLLNGIVIMRPGENISPTIYLEPYFEQYPGGMTMEEIVEDILSLYESNRDNALGIVENFKNFEALKGKIVYKVINRGANELLLSKVPYTPYLDLAVVYYLLLESNESGQMTALIHNEHLMLWDVSREELHRLAAENSQRLLPACIRPLVDIMREMIMQNVEKPENEEQICGLLDLDGKDACYPLFVLSNPVGMYGAACLLYDGVVEQFARGWESDVVILPSSTHEVLLLLWSEEMEYEDLKKMVQGVNGTMMMVEDILSDHVYIYRRKDGLVKMAI